MQSKYLFFVFSSLLDFVLQIARISSANFHVPSIKVGHGYFLL